MENLPDSLSTTKVYWHLVILDVKVCEDNTILIYAIVSNGEKTIDPFESNGSSITLTHIIKFNN